MRVAPDHAPDQLHVLFLTLLPRIETHAYFHFRHLRCLDTRRDRIAETVALAWQWFCRLHQRGKDVRQFPGHFTFLVTRAVKCGRRLCGGERTKEVFSPLAQQRHGFKVVPLPAPRSLSERRYAPHGQQSQDGFEERLQDNTITPIPEQVAFRLDWPPFLRTLSVRDRRIARFLALGHTAKQAAAKFGLSPGRVTQLRQQWCQQWRLFQEEHEVPG